MEVTVEQVRAFSGAPKELISDERIKILISTNRAKTEDLFGVKFVPTKRVETLNGEFKRKLVVSEYFPLTTLKLINGETEIDTNNLYEHTELGFIEIITLPTTFNLRGGIGSGFSGYNLDVKVKYLYGAIERDTSFQYETESDISKGNNVVVELDDTNNLVVGDWVFIEDLNKRKEVAQISDINFSTNNVTFKQLTKGFKSGALVSKARPMRIFMEYLLYECALAVAIEAIGSTYTFNTSYSIEGVSATRGVPYTHWRESASRSQSLRDELKVRIQSMLTALV